MTRPIGSVAEFHKTRRDYRFGQETMEHIAGGMAIFASILKETAFVERAIAHNAEFLAGDPDALALEIEPLRAQLQAAKQECNRAQEKNRDLDQQLRQARVTLRSLEDELRQAKAAAPKQAEKKLNLSKAYQIKIRHESYQECSILPQGFACDESAIPRSIREKTGNATI